MTGRKVEQFEEEIHLWFDERIGQFVDASEIFQRLFDGEFAVEGQFLWHVTDSGAGNAALFGARLTTKDVHFAAVETATTDDAAEQRRLAATASSQQSVSLEINMK